MNIHSRLGGRALKALVPMVVATGLVVAGAPADARPPAKPGAVQHLTIGTVTKPANAYVVPSTWDAVTGATSYKVSLSSAGVTLTSATVTATHWTTTTTKGAGTTVTVKVTAVASKRPGKSASASTTLPDVTAPVGAYDITQAPGARAVTLVQTALSDDLTPQGSITRTVNWDDSTAPQAWTSGTTLPHSYAVDLATYHPTVTLKDAANNTQVVELRTVVVGDNTAPAGSFGVSPTGWAKFSKVQLTQTSVTDNYSDPANVTRVVDWKDGTTSTWTGSTAPTHVYTVAGSYAPTVQLVDEALNSAAAVMANGVVVTADTGKPTASLVKPARHRTWVRSWVRTHGRASDAGTGVRTVQLRVVEKRGTAWFAYRGTTHRWVKGGTTQAAALKKTTLASVKPAAGAWTYRFSGLRKGALVVRVNAVDNVGNTSAVKVYKQSLTHS